MSKKILVLYHGNCPDGFSGAWAAYKRLGKKAEYIPLIHQEEPPKGLKNKVLYFIDFVYPEKIFKKIVDENEAVIALDHHPSAAKQIKLADDYIFDLDHSGAVIAWQYFHPKKPLPSLLKYIEDQDLWKFRQPKTKEINARLKFFDFSFKNWDKLASELDKKEIRKRFAQEGKLILDYRDLQIKELIETNSYMVNFEGHKILAANAPHFLVSELGNRLAAEKPPFSLIWSKLGDDGKIRVSLRGIGNKVDLSKLAAKYGGGGHKLAAGFSLPTNKKFPWKEIR